MAREIKFRGKTNKGNWLIGEIISLNNHKYIAPNNGDWFDFIEWVPENVFHAPDSEKYEVEENTIGQFTGQKDKNGREIYEGDILEYTNPITGVNLVKGYIVYDCNLCAFQFKNKKNQQYYMNPCNGNQEAMTIIGNIYDNPELLKGGEV